MAVRVKLLLLRHAEAISAKSPLLDKERPLSERGRKDALTTGLALSNCALVRPIVFVSAAKRATETWSAIQAAFTYHVEAVIRDDLYLASPQKLLEIIQEHGTREEKDTSPAPHDEEEEEQRSLLFIAHNPGLSVLARRLIAQNGGTDLPTDLAGGLPPAGFTLLEADRLDLSNLSSGRVRLLDYHFP